MKNFSKYITQGIGLAIGIVIVILAISGVLYIKSGFDTAKVEKEQERQVVIDFERRQLEKIGLGTAEIDDVINNGINIDEDGTYVIKTKSGSGDVVIYDLNISKKVMMVMAVNGSKEHEFEGRDGYKVVPGDGLEIKCIKK